MGNEHHHWLVSRGTTDANTPVEKKSIKVPDSRLQVCELLFIPSLETFVGIKPPELQRILELERLYDDAMREVLEANASGIRERIELAKNQLAAIFQPRHEDANKKLPVAGGAPKFTEVLRFNGRKYSFLPKDVVDSLSTDRRRWFGIKDLLEADETRKDRLTKADISGIKEPWYTSEGKINKKLLRDCLTKFKAKVDLKKFDLVKPTSGNIPSKYLFGALAPVASVAGLHERWGAAVDELVEFANKNANFQYTQYQNERDHAARLLVSDEFDEDDLGYVKWAAQYIWSADAASEAWLARVDKLRFPLSQEQRSRLAEEIRGRPLPPANYDVSAGAQFLRYSYGASTAFGFDLKKGQLSGNVSGSLDLALFSGKAEGKMYWPDASGTALTVAATKIHLESVWAAYGDDLCGTKPDGVLPGTAHFRFNRSLVDPGCMREIGIALAPVLHERATRPFGQEAEFRIQIIGHADQVGGEIANQRLSEQRARAVYGFLRRDVLIWLSLFLDGVWGDADIDDMLAFVLSTRTFSSRSDAVRAFQAYLRNTQLSQLASPPWLTSVAIRKQNLYGYFLRIDGGSSVASSNGKLTLIWLISEYFRLGHAHAALRNVRIEHFSYHDFSDPSIAGCGESTPLENTGLASEKNRRVEFHAYRVSGVRERQEAITVDLGHMRFAAAGHIGGYAGANVMASAAIEIDPKQGVLAATGRQTQGGAAGGSLGATAFAGAKAELGIKGSLEWKPPTPIPPPEKLGDARPEGKADFVALGSIGYTLTGSAGIGIEGEFKIGFDDQSAKFLIKAKAAACLGLGFGGQVEFSVGANHVYNFIVMVYQQIAKADFSYVDIFESTRVFDLFAAWSYELIKKGHLLTGVAALSIGAVGQAGIEIARKHRELELAWKKGDAKTDDVHSLIDALERKPTLLQYCTPETKGRMLHVLTGDPDDSNFIPYLKDIHLGGPYGVGIHERREVAVLLIMEHGIRTARDYRETLEHMGVGIPHTGLSAGREVSEGERQRILTERALRTDRNERRLLNLLDGAERKQFLEYRRRLME